MEMAQVTSLVERLTDDQLMQEMQRPSGMAPLQIVIAELQRRAALRGGKPKGFAGGGAVKEPVDEERAANIWNAVQAAFPGARMTSGYRTPQRQRELIANGAPAVENSRHLSGRAVDWTMPGGMSQAEAAAILSSKGLNFEDVIFHPENGSYHVEMGPTWEPGGSPAPVPAPRQEDLPGGYVSPANLASDAMSIGDVLAGQMGVGSVPTLEGAYGQAASFIPSNSPAYEKIVGQLQSQSEEAQRANKGRALMEMGLAMMQAKGPNFMSALGAGGMAGLKARDSIRTEEQSLMQNVVNAQLAQSEAEQRRSASILEAASGIRNSDQRTMAGAYSMGTDIARTGSASQNAAADSRSAMERQQDQQAFLAGEAEKERANRIEIANMARSAQGLGPDNPGAIYNRHFIDVYERLSSRIGQEKPGGTTSRPLRYTAADAWADADRVARQMTANQTGGTVPQSASPAAPAVSTGGNGPRVVSVRPVSGD